MIRYGQPLQIKAFNDVDDEWEVEGYPSVFNNIDLGKDIVLPGAYTKTLASARPKVKFLFGHDPAKVLGIAKDLHEDEYGLYGHFRISRTTLGQETHTLLKDGAVDAFSIGYLPESWEYATVDGQDVRKLKDINLMEVSLVAIAMNPLAAVTGVKDFSLSLAQKTTGLRADLEDLLQALQKLAAKDVYLTDTKRQELKELLATFASFDAVRSDLTTLLDVPNPHLARLTLHRLDTTRRRLVARGILED